MTKYLLLVLFIITTLISAKDYKGAEYRTKQSFTYGRFEASIKSAEKEGMLTSFFTYHDGGGDWNEIDIEIMGRYNDNVQYNTITSTGNHVRANFVKFNPALDFHTYAIEWTPEYIAWFIDGVETYRQTEDFIKVVNEPQKLMMNIWNPAYTTWAGRWNDNNLPVFTYYDWVSYYSYTPGTGNYGTGNNFTLQWKDDFNSWDTGRWDKATHTFDGNNCDFVQANAVFQDGKLILCLTRSDATGYVDHVSPVLQWARYADGKVTAYYSEAVDKTSAEDKTKFIIAGGVTIDSIHADSNPKIVNLYVTGLDVSKNYNVLALAGVKDLAIPANLSQNQAVPIHILKSITFPLKINIGGREASGYLTDQEFSTDVEYGFEDGASGQFNSPVSGTDEDNIYQTERNGLVDFRVRVPDGNYNVKLMMIEGWFNEAGKRVFDIYVEDSLVADDLDIFKQAGKNAAYDLTVSVNVNDGILDLHFPAEVDKATISGVVIDKGISDVKEGSIIDPVNFQLEQNYPNPFNGNTRIRYFLPAAANVEFGIYDILGKQIFFRELGVKNAGVNEIKWNAVNNNNSIVNSGVYFYRIKAGDNLLTKKLVHMK